MYEAGFTIADSKTGQPFHFQPSSKLANTLARIQYDLIQGGATPEHVESLIVMLATDIGQQLHEEAWRPLTIQEIAREAAQVYVPRVKALEVNVLEVAKMVSARLDPLESQIKQILANPSQLLPRVDLLEAQVSKIYESLELIGQRQRNSDTVHLALQNRLEAVEKELWGLEE